MGSLAFPLSLRRRAATALRSACFGLAVLAIAPRAAPATAPPRTSVPVIVPDAGDLQLLAFWVALGAGYFADQGMDVHVIAPSEPGQAAGLFTSSGAPIAVLSGPEYLRLIAADFPFELVANLFENEPLALVVKREIVQRLAVNTEMPVRQRLQAMNGLRIGAAVPARARLHQLFFAQGIDVNQTRVVTHKPEELLAEFASGEIDALYTQSPFLERAVIDKDGIVMVNPPGGEAPELASRVIQALVVTRAYAAAEPRVVAGLVRAIGRAEHLLHTDVSAATAAVVRVTRRTDGERLARGVSIYARAVPDAPRVDAKGITRELGFFPAEESAPRLAGIDLKRFVLAKARSEETSPSPSRAVLAMAGALVLLIALLAVLADARGEG